MSDSTTEEAQALATALMRDLAEGRMHVLGLMDRLNRLKLALLAIIDHGERVSAQIAAHVLEDEAKIGRAFFVELEMERRREKEERLH